MTARNPEQNQQLAKSWPTPATAAQKHPAAEGRLSWASPHPPLSSNPLGQTLSSPRDWTSPPQVLLPLPAPCPTWAGFMETLALLPGNSVNNWNSVWGSHSILIFILWYQLLNVRIFTQPTALHTLRTNRAWSLSPKQKVVLSYGSMKYIYLKTGEGLSQRK